MKKDTTRLEKHLKLHPKDANGVISLLKAKSANYEYDYLLEQKRKKEKARSFNRKRMEAQRNGN